MKLSDYSENKYSQFGEDGVVAKVFEIIGEPTVGYAVEFGAGDGLELSNTAQFWKDRGWNALLIEPDQERYRKLSFNTQNYDVDISSHAVTPTGAFAIDNFLDYGQEIDFMSVDVDDCEYQILKNMEARPRVLLVEFNYTMPHHLELVGAVGSRLQASPLAITRLVESMGYALVSITGCNCLFVRREYDWMFDSYITDYWQLVDKNASTFVVTDWLGKYIFVGPKPHGMSDPYEDPQWEIGP